VKWLAHAHNDHIGDLFSDFLQLSGVKEHLLDNLTAAQVALETHLAGCAKHAAHSAAGLSRDT
jgi:hypothetical protein